MNGVINLTSSDLILIIIFGTIYLIFGFGIVMGIYITGLKQVRENRLSLAELVMKATLYQLLATLVIWAFLITVNLQQQAGSMTNITVIDGVSLYFCLDWTALDFNYIVNYYKDNDLPAQALGLFLLLKALNSIVILSFIIIPFVIAIVVLFQIVKKHKDSRTTSSGFFETMSEAMMALLVVVFIFSIHLSIPEIILNDFILKSKPKIESVLKVSAPCRSELFTYKQIAQSVLRNAFLKTNFVATAKTTNGKTKIVKEEKTTGTYYPENGTI